MDHQIEKYMKNPLFENIAADHLQAMLGCLHSYTRNYKKGEVIIMEWRRTPSGTWASCLPERSI